MKNVFIFSTLFLIFIYTNQLHGQFYVGAQIKGNYWEHTKLYGTSIGMSISKIFKKSSIIFTYDYGFGSYDRLKKLKNLNDSYWTTVFVDKGQWFTDKGNNISSTLLRNAKTDYAKENRLSLMFSQNIINFSNKNSLNVGLGTSIAFVEHFFTFKNIIIYQIDNSPFYKGSLNYIPVSQQKFMTFSIFGSLKYDFNLYDKPISLLTNVAYGPHFGSSASIGFNVSTELLSKK